MPRYRITIEYDGTPFVGWQRQDNGPSIQQSIEEALDRFAPRADGALTEVIGSGRTDAGVHARGQVAHFDLDGDLTAFRVSEALNYHLKPAPIAILDCAIVGADFHARFSAVHRRYLYRIENRRAPLVLERDRAWAIPHALDHEAMHRAAQALVGNHDFTTFRAAMCQAKSPVRTLDRLDVRREGEAVLIETAARSFLHHQVRNIAGTLAQVGLGRWREEDVAAALGARDRSAGGPTAPAAGLYFMEVRFEGEEP